VAAPHYAVGPWRAAGSGAGGRAVRGGAGGGHGTAAQTLPATSSTRVLSPRLVSYTASYDVTSDIWQALDDGVVDGAGARTRGRGAGVRRRRAAAGLARRRRHRARRSVPAGTAVHSSTSHLTLNRCCHRNYPTYPAKSAHVKPESGGVQAPGCRPFPSRSRTPPCEIKSYPPSPVTAKPAGACQCSSGGCRLLRSCR